MSQNKDFLQFSKSVPGACASKREETVSPTLHPLCPGERSAHGRDSRPLLHEPRVVEGVGLGERKHVCSTSAESPSLAARR